MSVARRSREDRGPGELDSQWDVRKAAPRRVGLQLEPAESSPDHHTQARSTVTDAGRRPRSHMNQQPQDRSEDVSTTNTADKSSHLLGLVGRMSSRRAQPKSRRCFLYLGAAPPPSHVVERKK